MQDLVNDEPDTVNWGERDVVNEAEYLQAMTDLQMLIDIEKLPPGMIEPRLNPRRQYLPKKTLLPGALYALGYDNIQNGIPVPNVARRAHSHDSAIRAVEREMMYMLFYPQQSSNAEWDHETTGAFYSQGMNWGIGTFAEKPRLKLHQLQIVCKIGINVQNLWNVKDLNTRMEAIEDQYTAANLNWDDSTFRGPDRHLTEEQRRTIELESSGGYRSGKWLQAVLDNLQNSAPKFIHPPLALGQHSLPYLMAESVARFQRSEGPSKEKLADKTHIPIVAAVVQGNPPILQAFSFETK